MFCRARRGHVCPTRTAIICSQSHSQSLLTSSTDLPFISLVQAWQCRPKIRPSPSLRGWVTSFALVHTWKISYLPERKWYQLWSTNPQSFRMLDSTRSTRANPHPCTHATVKIIMVRVLPSSWLKFRTRTKVREAQAHSHSWKTSNSLVRLALTELRHQSCINCGWWKQEPEHGSAFGTKSVQGNLFQIFTRNNPH